MALTALPVDAPGFREGYFPDSTKGGQGRPSCCPAGEPADYFMATLFPADSGVTTVRPRIFHICMPPR
jgi:hypothetical protein